MSTLDQSVLENYPVIVMPHENALPAPTKDGIRTILGSHGLYREISTCWMIRRKLQASVILPYGHMIESVEFLIDAPHADIWKEFIVMARNVFPNECAGLMVWNKKSNQWRLEMRHSIRASAGRVDYREVYLDDEDDVGVVDIHSHGQFPASFSYRDDQDDCGGLKIAAVIGKVNQSTPEFVMRLVGLDEFIPITLTKDQKFKEIVNETLFA